MKCAAPRLRLLFSTLFLSLALSPCFAQVVISESDYQQLVKNLQLVKIELKNWGDSLNQRELVLSAREASLSRREQDLTERERDLQTKEDLIVELRNSLTIASESLRLADSEAAKLEAENKFLKWGGAAGWLVAAVAVVILIIF